MVVSVGVKVQGSLEIRSGMATWWGPCNARVLRTVLRGAEGEIPLAYSPSRRLPDFCALQLRIPHSQFLACIKDGRDQILAGRPPGAAQNIITLMLSPRDAGRRRTGVRSRRLLVLSHH
jgi:hypothetical protein